YSPCPLQRAIILVIGIIHHIGLKAGLKACFIETFIVGNQRTSFNQRIHLRPNIRKNTSMYCIPSSNSMNAQIYLAVIIAFRSKQTVETVAYLTITHYNNPNTAHAGRKLICSLKIYCRETLQYRTHIFNITIPKVEKKAHR